MPTTPRLFTLNRLAIEPSTAWYLNDLGELRVGEQKREMVIKGIAALLAKPGSAFKISALEQACPGVSRDMIRHVMMPESKMFDLIFRYLGRHTPIFTALFSSIYDGSFRVLRRFAPRFTVNVSTLLAPH